MFIPNSEALRSAGWTVDYPPCFLRKPSSCDVSTFNPTGCSEDQDVSTCSDYQIIGKHTDIPGHLFGVEDLSSIKNSTAPPRKRHPHPLAASSLSSLLPSTRAWTPTKKISTSPKHHPLWVAGFLSTHWEPNSKVNPQKQLKGTNTEYKNTIWYALRHFEKNYDL